MYEVKLTIKPTAMNYSSLQQKALTIVTSTYRPLAQALFGHDYCTGSVNRRRHHGTEHRQTDNKQCDH